MPKRETLTLQEVFLARKRIAPVARRTPLVFSERLSQCTGSRVFLKLETCQETGAFKVRGAANKLGCLDEAARAAGVVTVSTGNHGRAVAYVAQKLGIPAVVCMSAHVPDNKLDAVRTLGAELSLGGESQDAAAERARELAARRGLTLIHPFDDPAVIAGQGTIALELLEDLPEIDTAVVPVSGGGLISGIALVLKRVNPAIRVVGVSMERGAVMHRSLAAGRPVELPEEETLADSLRGGIGLDNRHTFRLVSEYVDDLVLVSEEEIAEAMRYALTTHKLVLEGAAAVGIAALRAGRVAPLGRAVALVLSGGNVDMRALAAARRAEETG